MLFCLSELLTGPVLIDATHQPHCYGTIDGLLHDAHSKLFRGGWTHELICAKINDKRLATMPVLHHRGVGFVSLTKISTPKRR